MSPSVLMNPGRSANHCCFLVCSPCGGSQPWGFERVALTDVGSVFRIIIPWEHPAQELGSTEG